MPVGKVFNAAELAYTATPNAAMANRKAFNAALEAQKLQNEAAEFAVDNQEEDRERTIAAEKKSQDLMDAQISEYGRKIGADKAVSEANDFIGIWGGIEELIGGGAPQEDITAFADKEMDRWIQTMEVSPETNALIEKSKDGWQKEELVQLYKTAMATNKQFSSGASAKPDYTMDGVRYSGVDNKPIAGSNSDKHSPRHQQALDGGLTEGTPEFNSFVLGDSKGTPTAKETEIQTYVNMGETYDKAVDLAYGNLDVTGSTDELGYVTVTNKRTGESYKVAARAARAAGLDIPEDTKAAAKEDPWDAPVASVAPSSGLNTEVVKKAQLDMVVQDEALMQAAVISGADIEEGVGSMSNLQRGLNSMSQFSTLNMAPRFAEDETLAADKLAKFVQLSKAALLNSSRGAIWEQQRVEAILPNPNNWFSDPEGEGYKYTQTVQAMMQQRENNVALLNGRKPNLIQRIPMGTQSDPIVVPPGQDIQELLIPENVGRWVFYNGAATEIGAR